MKRKIHAFMSFDESFTSFTCRWSHGWGSLECQCRLEFAHEGECVCYDSTCSQRWKRPTL